MTQKYTKEEIEEAFQVDMPYFYHLQNKIREVEVRGNGQVQLTVRIYKGKAQDYVVTDSARYVIE